MCLLVFVTNQNIMRVTTMSAGPPQPPQIRALTPLPVAVNITEPRLSSQLRLTQRQEHNNTSPKLHQRLL